MAKLRGLTTLPYSGWHHRPWGNGSDRCSTEEAIAVDAAARTARRVVEPISWLIRNLDLVSRRSNYSIMMLNADDEDFGVNLLVRPRDAFLGHLLVPVGFHDVSTKHRASLIGEGVRIMLAELAEIEGWDPTPAMAGIRDLQERDFEFEWCSRWKSTRDRRRRVQLTARLADDGYARLRVRVMGAEPEDLLIETEEFLGWTWIENAERAAKAMKFIAPHLLEVPSGSGFWPQVVTVNIETGEIQRSVEEPAFGLRPSRSAEYLPTLVVTRPEQSGPC